VSGWNHNTHYYPVVLDAVPAGASRALDVGCGEGRLARSLARSVPEVVALEPHLPTLAAARAAGGGTGRVGYVAGAGWRDLPFTALSVVAHQWHHRRRPGVWTSSAHIVWPPPRTYRQVRAMAREVLPGTAYRRRLLWRYTLVWQKGQSKSLPR
jgi:SAM-dependent methyltransferase